ncbi:glycosyl hydrolase 108 family protein [Sphingomonas crocodyli]|uniref:Uncharacterized protein n=1 Tax=Sphingomonas crocodyli TaxID=1979270 RepID=A0A437LVU7_9SPHN|nr:glycosyl hydrolase 108 family protein [Sphingomonas crocodyli]RVT89510.1 hypothetical protein EOD43_22395 [Sphingomonas crocodyli]
MDVAQFIEGFITDHEGGLSVDTDDTGNWFHEKGRSPILVGSKYGVTGATLAAFRKVPRVTAIDMALLKKAEAVRIGVHLYYEQPDFDLLPWNQLTASLVDMGWGAGPGQATRLFQRMIGANDDGRMGPRTVAAFHQFVKAHGLMDAAVRWGEARAAFYERIIAVRPTNAKYRNGWRNRTASFLPGMDWWDKWPSSDPFPNLEMPGVSRK